MNTDKKTITIKDVAKAAGVSTATVSRVLSNSPKVTAKTKTKVLAVQKKLSYIPNSAAYSLASKNPLESVAVIISEDIQMAFLNPYFTEVIRGVATYAQQNNFYMNILAYSNYDVAFKEISTLYYSKKIAGIILLEIKKDDLLVQKLIQENIPFILNGRFEKEIPNTFSINTNSVESSYTIVKHLIKKGHSNIAFINGDPEFIVNQDREKGYRLALKENNINIIQQRIIYTDNSFENNKTIITDLINNDPGITAIFAKDDLKAYYIIKILQELGKKIPDEVSVVGHNDYNFSQLCQPSLTTIQVPIYEMGYTLAKILIDLLRKNTIDKAHLIMETLLIDRDSVK